MSRTNSITSPTIEERDRAIAERISRAEAAMKQALDDKFEQHSAYHSNSGVSVQDDKLRRLNQELRDARAADLALQRRSNPSAGSSGPSSPAAVTATSTTTTAVSERKSRSPPHNQGTAHSQRPQSRSMPNSERAAAMEEARRMEENERLAQERALQQQQQRLAYAAESGQSQGKRRVILIMTVEIGDGRSDQIRIHEDDDPRMLAVQFVQKHGLGEHVVDPLSDHIRANIRNIQPQIAKEKEKERERKRLEEKSRKERIEALAQPRDRVKSPPPHSASASTFSSPGLAPPHPPPPVSVPASSASLYTPTSTTATTATTTTSSSSSSSSVHVSVSASSSESASLPAPPRVPPSNSKAATTAVQQRPSTAEGRDEIVAHNASASYESSSPLHDSYGVDQNGSTVFSRLHSDSFVRVKHNEEVRQRHEEQKDADLRSRRRGMSSVSRSINQQRADGYDNFGDRLYKEGMRKREERDKEAEKARKEAENDPEATFKPQISQVARRMQGDAPSTKNEHLHRLLTSNEDREAARLRLALEEERRKMEGCTFQPQINRRSELLVSEKDRLLKEQHMTHYDQLFLDAERRRLRQLEYEQLAEQEATFRPQTEKSSVFARKVQRQRDGENFDDFINRLVYSKQERDAVIEELKQQQADARVDPITGQPLFRPRLESARSNESSSNSDEQRSASVVSNRNVSDHLYNARTEIEAVRQRLEQKEKDKVAQMANMTHSSEKSQKLFEEKKKKKFSILFSMLDSMDRDGFISADSCNTALLRSEVAREVLYILHSDPDKQYSFAEFSDALDKRLHKQHIAVGAFMSYIYDPLEDRARVQEESEFRPQISERSAVLASKKRVDHQPLHEALFQDAKKSEQKRLEKKREMDEAELKECTFDPVSSRSRSLSDAGKTASRRPMSAKS
eukprot:ANDGO_00887.mRNA.1 hypothetical protein NAEGRDRAFT_79231